MTVLVNDKKVKYLMFLNGYNNNILAEELNIGSSYLSLVLKNKRKPSPMLAKKLAEKLGVNIDDIFTFNEMEASK
ncbi:helix-turn-helix domain-containing protein [Staphylococcus hominis]|uniref:helix-turn-helix domain-containing protein n=1 Tax=Staphylococcus hominis TaxID=1290 RepID=UPI000989F93B|nr:helix-turn-helix transcriptional regulator [Staphylococcus hominis]